jgi:hypothetical protein
MSSMTAKLQLYIITGISKSPAAVPLGPTSVAMSGSSLGHDCRRWEHSQIESLSIYFVVEIAQKNNQIVIKRGIENNYIYT